MKKMLSVFLVVMLILVSTTSVYAKDTATSDTENAYSALEKAADSLLRNNTDNSIRFCDLSADMTKYLEENSIDTDCIGKLYCQDTDSVSSVIALYYSEDNTLVMSSLTSYGQNAAGEYVKTISPALRTSGWTVGSWAQSYPLTQLTVTASIYLESYYVNVLEVYYRPFQLVFWYTNSSGYSPTVTNFSAQGVARGKSYTFSGATFTLTGNYYDWVTSRTVASPVSGIHYTQTQYMPNGLCMEAPYSSYTDGALYINGQRSTYHVNYFGL